MFMLLSLFFVFSSPVSAGGIECQMHGSCPCYFQGTCDKFGNPLPPKGQAQSAGLDPCMADCLRPGTNASVCLRRCHPHLPQSQLRGPTIECGSKDPFRVVLGTPFPEMPREGQVPASFENLGLALNDYVETSIEPPFSLRSIRFLTAYCQFKVLVDSAGSAGHFVFKAFQECEGESREISCRLKE